MLKKSINVVANQYDDPDSVEALEAENSQFEGYCADLAKKIADTIEFRYRIVPVKDDKYGSLENGTWNGMVGELIRNVCTYCCMITPNITFLLIADASFLQLNTYEKVH